MNCIFREKGGKSWDTESINISWRTTGKAWNDFSVGVCHEIIYSKYVIWGKFWRGIIYEDVVRVQGSKNGAIILFWV